MRILEGPLGHLFLNNDTNDTAGQFRGDILISDENVRAWKNYFEELHAKAKEADANICFMVAPAKEEVFSDLYPVRRAETTPIDQLTRIATGVPFLFPIVELKLDRGLSYSRTDTHWTDFGARVAAGTFLRQAGLEEHIACLPSVFHIIENSGDLGRKLTPPVTEPWMRAKLNPAPEILYDNYIKNHGRMWILQNQAAPVAETLVIFGDSFGITLTKCLALVFQRTVYCHTAAMWDEFVIEHEQPRYVLLEMAQRFIVSPPLDRKLWDSVAQKVSDFDEASRERLRQQAIQHAETTVYARRTLEFLQ